VLWLYNMLHSVHSVPPRHADQHTRYVQECNTPCPHPPTRLITIHLRQMTYCISGSPSLIIWMKTFARCKGNHLDTLPYQPCRQHWTKSHSRPLQPYDYLAPRYSCESPNGIVVTTETEGKKAVQTHLLMVPHHPSCQPIPKQWGIEPHALPNTPVCPGTFR